MSTNSFSERLEFLQCELTHIIYNALRQCIAHVPVRHYSHTSKYIIVPQYSLFFHSEPTILRFPSLKAPPYTCRPPLAHPRLPYSSSMFHADVMAAVLIRCSQETICSTVYANIQSYIFLYWGPVIRVGLNLLGRRLCLAASRPAVSCISRSLRHPAHLS